MSVAATSTSIALGKLRAGVRLRYGPACSLGERIPAGRDTLHSRHAAAPLRSSAKPFHSDRSRGGAPFGTSACCLGPHGRGCLHRKLTPTWQLRQIQQRCRERRICLLSFNPGWSTRFPTQLRITSALEMGVIFKFQTQICLKTCFDSGNANFFSNISNYLAHN